MALTMFEYVTSNGDGVMLMARDEPMVVQAMIPAEAIDAFFDLRNVSARDRQRLVLSNLQLFGRIATGKYERGEVHYRDIADMRIANIRVSLFDLEASGLLRKMDAPRRQT